MIKLDIAAFMGALTATAEFKKCLADVFRQVVKEELAILLKDDLVNSKEAAEILGMSVAALRKAVERGQVPCVRIGSRLRFRRAALLQR